MDKKDKLQKPKPTTDGKQTAGHSYSTRANVKRSSHSDDDRSSGSKAQEPTLKRHRQTRPGGKQGGTSVGINNDDPNPVNSNTVDEYAPAEIALQNDLVLKTLFTYVNKRDLLSCRIVNKQWQIEVTKELRRRKLVIRFYFRRHENQASRNIIFQNICRRLNECNTPSLLWAFQVKTVALNDLLGSAAGYTSFFPTVGNQLKHLTLHLDYTWRSDSFKSSSLTTDLRNLLFRQVPNLEFLEIEFNFHPHMQAELETLDLFGQNQNDHHNDNNFLMLLPNLKTFIVTGSPTPKFLADVVNAAVNLRFLGGDLSTCSQYLIGAEERAKIHLLKSMNFDLASSWQFDENSFVGFIELMETFLTEQKENLKLESFECLTGMFEIGENASLTLRMVGLINQILEWSAGSLLKLIMEPAKLFRDALIIPHLPKLQEIVLDCHMSSVKDLDGGGGGGGGYFFPREFNMNISFPNVSSIFLLGWAPSLFRVFVSRMEIEMTEPIPSIRRIIVMIAAGGRSHGSSVSSPLASDFHHIFPNLLSVRYVASGKYYKI